MRRPIPLLCLALFPLILSDVARAQQPADILISPRTQRRALAKAEAASERRIRDESIGLRPLRPYVRGKMPVVLVHGFWMGPRSWRRMVERLEDDPVLREHYQFWTFGYSTGDPILYSAYLLRRNLDEARRTLDPDRSDGAFDRMVIVGHSMGGLLAKMMAIDPGDRLWRVITDRPFDELQGDPRDVELFRASLIFGPRPEVRRVVFIATPHLGSELNRGAVKWVGTRLVRTPEPLRSAHRRLVERNAATYFRDPFRRRLPSSIDELARGSPTLAGLYGIPLAPAVTAHSIIAVRADSPRGAPTDGVVRFDSASVAGTASETIVSAGHMCQDHTEVIAEVRRILTEGAGS